MSRLTDHWYQVLEIRKLLAQGDLAHVAIGKQFGVSKQLVSCIKRGKAWKHL